MMMMKRMIKHPRCILGAFTEIGFQYCVHPRCLYGSKLIVCVRDAYSVPLRKSEFNTVFILGAFTDLNLLCVYAMRTRCLYEKRNSILCSS